MVRYRVKPGQAERNEELVRAVYSYATFRMDDGLTFVHLAQSEGPDSPLPQLDAFREFQKDIAARCDEPPVVTKLSEVGSFRFGWS
jgi:hypothetical protein